jgi:sigma-B regulation protein RsbU (phosphoserine phosphatase)
MKILLAWDDPSEADLLRLYLGAGDSEVTVCLNHAEALGQAQHGLWDVVLLALTCGGGDGLALFGQLTAALPGVPLVVACRTTEMLHLPRFLTRGLRFYIIRDAGGDYVFLLLSYLESAVAALRAEEARKLADRLREEMDGVRRLQESIIPRGLQPPPGYRVAARYESAQVHVNGDRPVVMAGGDYYDLFRPDDRTLVVLVGDASGHGLKACMSIMTMHTLVRMIPGHRYRDTASFVAEINQRLCDNSIVQSGGGFITLLYAAIDTAAHTVTWTSAGHPLALLHRLDTDEVIQVGTAADGGLPLAVTPDVGYTAATVALPPASRLLVYTDGLTDAFPADGAEHVAFGVAGISAALRSRRGRDLDEALAELFAASQAFTGGSGRHDDTSAVLLERLGE